MGADLGQEGSWKWEGVGEDGYGPQASGLLWGWQGR